jgi:P-loop containing dynein motor region/Dynein heavy chain AAA lid domain
VALCSSKFLLRNFLSLLTIFLSELRKSALSFSLFESFSSPFFGSIRRFETLTELQKTTLEKTYENKIEAVFLFSLIFGIFIFLKPIMQEEFAFFIRKKIESFQAGIWWKGRTEFACGWKQQVKSPFNFCFNVVTNQWTSWNEMKIPSIDNMLIDYQSNEMTLRELFYFNPDLKKVDAFRNQLESEKLSIFILPGRKLFIETPHSRKNSFFLSYAISYQKRALLLGPRNNGKTSIVQEKLWNLLARGEFGVLQIGVNGDMEGSQFRKKVEKSFLNRESSFLKIYGGKVVVFVDDLNLCSEKYIFSLFVFRVFS